jgi:bifunctional ADP-heptose synthase (sugar kinase/adenylyltransferase)
VLHFKAARGFGDRLVVTVTPDRYVGKGPGRPLFSEELRLMMVEELRVVDAAALNLWPSAVETIRRLRPAVFAKGADYRDRARCNPNIEAEAQAALQAGGVLAYTDEPAFSSTALIEWVRGISR